MFKTIFIIAVAVVGLIEVIKNYLPSKVKENKTLLTIMSNVIAGGAAACYVAFGNKIGFVVGNANWVTWVTYIAGTIGVVQTSYATLYKVFQAIIKKLKTTYAGEIDPDQVAEEIAEEIGNKVTEKLGK